MTVPDRRSLPPMSATEFAIDKAFRHVFFALGLALAWLVALLPLVALAWYAALRNGLPDPQALTPGALAALGLLAAGLVLALFSCAVSWQRRILLGERAPGLRRLRLDGAVWRHLLGVIFVGLVLGIYAGLGVAILTQGVPLLTPQLGAAARPLAIGLVVLLGLSGLFSLYRLLGWLAGIAVADRGCTLGTVWRRTRGNRLAYLAFTFWLLFSLAIAGAIGAGAFFAQQALPGPWSRGAAFAAIAVLAWLALLVLASIGAAQYHYLLEPVENGEKE